MKQEIKVPSMGESINEATISALLKPPGSSVQMDDELLELATDKVNQVLYAPQAGIFTPTVKEDDVVAIGQVVGYIEEAKPSDQAVEKAPEQIKKEEKAPPKEPAKLEKSPIKAEPSGEPSEKPYKARFTTQDFITDLNHPEEELPPSKEAKQPTPISVGGERKEVRSKMSRIRKVIAKRLVEVQQTTAMLTTFNEVDLTEMMEWREKYKETFQKKYNARLGLMSFFVTASVMALQKFPEVNSYIDGEEIVQRKYYDIGIAVGTEKGLVVPIIRNCDKLTMAQIEKSISAYAAKVKDGSLSADDLIGGGFTITNGGVYGSLLSTPILSPQQCAILGMHKIVKRPVVINDEIVIRQMMYLALSYDHRIIDGKEAVSFLVEIKNLLEDPARLLLNV